MHISRPFLPLVILMLSPEDFRIDLSGRRLVVGGGRKIGLLCYLVKGMMSGPEAAGLGFQHK
ncbi:carboxylesterase [Histoplasma capsulatum var. duboisii H88]|uniref:Carboxylesterase n=1 Tax=Ajellomyces capsulatus (strain H88) TaxID=544711 RepID=A0A8A1LV32_AJEC8|nr:carboxylesterase [Histoplasma capsulatum var. duboisii H88]